MQSLERVDWRELTTWEATEASKLKVVEAWTRQWSKSTWSWQWTGLDPGMRGRSYLGVLFEVSGTSLPHSLHLVLPWVSKIRPVLHETTASSLLSLEGCLSRIRGCHLPSAERGPSRGWGMLIRKGQRRGKDNDRHLLWGFGGSGGTRMGRWNWWPQFS